MKIYKSALFIITLIFCINPGSNAIAQQESQQSTSRSSTNLNLEFNSIFQGYYYQDALSTLIAGEMTPIDESIDLTNYTLGPNDLISISIQANQNVVLRGLFVNPSGDIVVPSLGNIHVKDQTIEEAENTILNKAGEVFRDPEVTVTLEYPRPPTIHVSGDIPFPGKYTIPAFSRTDVATYYGFETIQLDQETGKPLQLKTSNLLSYDGFNFRDITIKRENDNNNNERADLVTYFKTGNLEVNPIIRDGDRIIVRKMNNDSPQVSISGAVRNSQEFNYNPSDTPERLIDLAGGYNPNADTTLIYIFRNENRVTSRKEIKRSLWSSVQLQPNDRVVVPESDKFVSNSSASVEGEVKIPGMFPINNGETTALELLTLAGNLTNKALPSAAYLERASYLKNQAPDKFNPQILKRTSDQVEQGFEYLELETSLSQNKVFVDLTDKEQLSGVKIYDGDRLFVPRDEETVFVFGQINNPGYYPFTSADQTVQDYIKRAGGYALAANPDRVFIIKAGTGTWYEPKDTDLESGDRVFVDREPFDELNAQRTYEISKQQLKNTRTQLIMTGLTTITSIITTIIAIRK